MAVKMRLRRMGRRNRPFYRLVVADSRYPRDGRFVDQVGHYDPLCDPAEVVLDEEKVMKWLGNGVELSDTVRSILSREGVLKRWRESGAGRSEAAEKASGGPADESDEETAAVEAKAGARRATAEKRAPKKDESKTEKKTAKKTEEDSK